MNFEEGYKPSSMEEGYKPSSISLFLQGGHEEPRGARTPRGSEMTNDINAARGGRVCVLALLYFFTQKFGLRVGPEKGDD